MRSEGRVCQYEGPRVLLVEGRDDCHVVMSLCAAYRVPETFGIFSCGSDQRILKRLNALISQPDPPVTIGVVLDADRPDSELSSRFCAWLRELFS